MDEFQIKNIFPQKKDLKKVRSVIARYKNKSIDTSNSSYVSKVSHVSIVSIRDENKILDTCIRNDSE